MNYDSLVICGPTASGKTHLAVQMAAQLDSEILSADSRQVYCGLDLGSGKDLEEYSIAINNFSEKKQIPYHLIDLVIPGTNYTLYQYLNDFNSSLEKVQQKKKLPIICGGSGLYLEAAIKNYQLPNVPLNEKLRTELAQEDLFSLQKRFQQTKDYPFSCDLSSKKRLIRALEIIEFNENHDLASNQIRASELSPLIIVLAYSRQTLIKRIDQRLAFRWQAGLIEEVENLLAKNISPDWLQRLGLEYKFVTLFLLKEMSEDEAYHKLQIAIHQFSKRQMTWFRGMPKRGLRSIWLNPQETDILNEIEHLLLP